MGYILNEIAMMTYRHRFKKQEQGHDRQDIYLNAKTQAIRLLSDAQLFQPQQKHRFALCVADIAHGMNKCSSQQQGEIFLLLCCSARVAGFSSSDLPLPSDFVGTVLAYLTSLLEVGLGVSTQRSTPQIYTNRFRNKIQQSVPQENKGKFRDLLIIDRYDVVLLQILQGQKQRNQPCKWKVSKYFITFLLSTIKMAERYFQKEKAEEYKNNIGAIINLLSQGKKIKEYKSVHKNFMLIDSKQVVAQSILPIQKPKGKRISSSFSSNSLLRAQSNNDEMLLTLTLKKESKKKISSHYNSASHHKRGSGSSSCSKRSSLQKNSSVVNNLAGIHHSILKNKGGIRTSANFMNITPPVIEINSKKQRRSRFNLLTALEEETLKNQFVMMKEQSYKESEEGEVRHRNISRVCSFKEQDVPGVDFRFRPFYFFIEKANRIQIVQVEHNAQEYIYFKIGFDRFEVKIKNETYCYLLEIDLNEDDDLIVEAFCQQYIASNMTLGCKFNRWTFEPKICENEDSTVNLIVLPETKTQILIGFIRKISTYFIQLSKYTKKPPQLCHNTSIKKKLLMENGVLPFSLEIRNKLLNCQLTMSFQEEEVQMVQRGSILRYIQNQEQSVEVFRHQGFNTSYKVVPENCALKEGEQVLYRVLWSNSDAPVFHAKKKKGRRNASSKISKIITIDEVTTKKLKKTGHHKSSIKLHRPSYQLQTLCQDYELNKLTRFNSKRQMTVNSQRKFITEGGKNIKQKTKQQRMKDKRTKTMIETIQTERGYKLLKKTVVQNIEGCQYNQYLGYKQRNPQCTRYYKNKDSQIEKSSSFSTNLTIRGNKNRKIGHSSLITFVKAMKNQEDVFLCYLVSSIKILTESPNHCIFIQCYYQKLQKYYIFTISSELFQKLTDINTTTFKDKPIKITEDVSLRKREKRTSVMNTLRFRAWTLGEMDSTLTKSKVNRENSWNVSNQEQNKSRFKDKEKKNLVSAKHNITAQSIHTHTLPKTYQSIRDKKELISHIRHKFIKNITFQWKNHVLQMIVKPSVQNLQSFNRPYVFEGKELALKNVHEEVDNPQKCAATELILIKYQESNMTNLSYYTMEGLSKLTLQHIFIKNNNSLYSRYKNNLGLNLLPTEIKMNSYYRHNNSFFQTKQEQIPRNIPRMNATLSKLSSRQDQKRFKYVQIINYSKECILPLSYLQHKRKRNTKKTFIIPNRYKYLYEDGELFLHVHLYQEKIDVSRLNGDVIIDFYYQKLEQYFINIRKLNLRQRKEILLRRVLVDEDMIRLCMNT